MGWCRLSGIALRPRVARPISASLRRTLWFSVQACCHSAITPAESHEQAGSSQRVEWLPVPEQTENFMKRISLFPEVITS